MYTSSNWLQPQIYADPNKGAIVTPPNGWGLQVVQKQKPRGMGVFDSWDPTTWGLAEWVIIGVSAYFILNVGKGGGGSRRKRKGKGRRKAASGGGVPFIGAGKERGGLERLSARHQAQVRRALEDE